MLYYFTNFCNFLQQFILKYLIINIFITIFKFECYLCTMFRTILNDKIGNTLIYLAERINDLSLTKALKLLYIIDEMSVKETGVPVTWLEYKAWKYGPVSEEIYNEVKNRVKCHNNRPLSLESYIKVKPFINPKEVASENLYLEPINDFDDSEFTDYEINLLDKIIDKYGNHTAKWLVELLHKEGSLWDNAVKDGDLELSFELQNNRSNHVIELTELLQNDEIRKMAYKSAFESLRLQEELS
jgi:uncharacterized phage-associated protein